MKLKKKIKKVLTKLVDSVYDCGKLSNSTRATLLLTKAKISINQIITDHKAEKKTKKDIGFDTSPLKEVHVTFECNGNADIHITEFQNEIESECDDADLRACMRILGDAHLYFSKILGCTKKRQQIISDEVIEQVKEADKAINALSDAAEKAEAIMHRDRLDDIAGKYTHHICVIRIVYGKLKSYTDTELLIEHATKLNTHPYTLLEICGDNFDVYLAKEKAKQATVKAIKDRDDVIGRFIKAAKELSNSGFCVSDFTKPFSNFKLKKKTVSFDLDLDYFDNIELEYYDVPGCRTGICDICLLSKPCFDIRGVRSPYVESCNKHISNVSDIK